MLIFPGSALDQPSKVSWKLALKMYTNNRKKRKRHNNQKPGAKINREWVYPGK
jgi:hypothetical protein